MAMEEKKDLIYGLNDRPPLRETCFAALQHLLSIFVAIITPPLIISSALKYDVQTTGFLVSMSLFVSGIATFIQSRRVGPIGTGLLCIQGTSFSFITPIIGAGMLGMVNGKMDVGLGLSYIFGGCMAASVVEMAVSRLLPYTRKVITPLVAGRPPSITIRSVRLTIWGWRCWCWCPSSFSTVPTTVFCAWALLCWVS